MPSPEKGEKWHRFDNWVARLLFKRPTLISLCVRRGCVKPLETRSTRVVYRLGAFVVWFSVLTLAADNRLKHDKLTSGPWGDAPWTLWQLPVHSVALWRIDDEMSKCRGAKWWNHLPFFFLHDCQNVKQWHTYGSNWAVTLHDCCKGRPSNLPSYRKNSLYSPSTQVPFCFWQKQEATAASCL